jgi:hypothetical protein
MAARDNTALHAALIIMVLLTVLLSVMTYVYFGSAEEQKRLLAAEREKSNGQQTQLRSLNSELRVLKFVTGWDPTLQPNDVEGEIAALGDQGANARQVFQGYKADVARFAEGLTGPTYRNIPEHMLAALKSKNDQLANTLNKLRQLEAEVKDVTTREVNRSKEFEKNAQKAASDLAAQIAAHDQERSKWSAEKDTLKKQVSDLGTQINQVRTDTEKEKKIANDNVVRTKREMDIVRQELAKYQKHENFEVPNGKITQVNQKTGTVFVNIGKADGLRKQVTFSVYDQAENSATKAQKKAGIEIIRVIDDHNSEGRIIHSTNTNPILPGDWVYSPVWSTGPFLHFALTPWVDIDGDGTNDRELVQNLIERNQGIIDSPNVTISTRYLVDIGDLPVKSVAGDQLESIRTQRNNLRSQAQEYGTKIINVHELLIYMGWKPQDKVITFGSTSSSESIRERASTDAGFRERKPPR